MSKKTKYKKAGVDIEAGEQAVKLMKSAVRSTFRREVLSDLGGFSGLFSLDLHKYQQPVLVASTDGVGTKLKIAEMLDKHDTIGIDLVAMGVNDILVHGAEPLFFLDYVATGKLNPVKISAIVSGIAEGCRQAGCSLLGGETAEMPGFYQGESYDLAGFAVGVVEKTKIVDGHAIEEGDVALGLASTGLHSNGYSLARQVLLDDHRLDLSAKPEGLRRTLGEELLTPTRVYVQSVLALLQVCRVNGLVNITGGGLTNNISRVLPKGLGVELDFHWDIPPIFHLIQKLGQIEPAEMRQVFNLGVGFVIILPEFEQQKAYDVLTEKGEKVFTIGRVKKGVKRVIVKENEEKNIG